MLAIDLFCGLGGWTEGLLAQSWRVVGFDIKRHQYGAKQYPAQLVLQDVTTLHGWQFRNAALLVASPPCQTYSWLAMPWSRSADPEQSKAAKALRKKWETEGPDNRLFDACFRIQREASYARRLMLGCCKLNFEEKPCPRCRIPLIVENVRGAQEWVGRAKANYGSFYFWGDVEQIGNRIQAGADILRFGAGLWMPTRPQKTDGSKVGGDWFRDPVCHSRHGSKSPARKAAAALIARIPRQVSEYVAQAVRGDRA